MIRLWSFRCGVIGQVPNLTKNAAWRAMAESFRLILSWFLSRLFLFVLVTTRQEPFSLVFLHSITRTSIKYALQ